jgi:uridine kinase
MIIAIGGCSRSGKTVLADRLAEYWGRDRTTILHQDEWALPENQLPMIRDHLDWEVPESIDWTGLRTEIARLDKRYPKVILEGIFAFSDPEILEMTDIFISVEIDKETFYQRKKVDLRWGREPDWYINHIWESYHKRLGEVPEEAFFVKPIISK